MRGERSSSGSWGIVAPGVAPVASAVVERDDHWRSFDNSVNAVSFGFVATAILISMFLVMAIFERFLRSRSTAAGGRNRGDLEAQMMSNGKLEYPSPKKQRLDKGVAVMAPFCVQAPSIHPKILENNTFDRSIVPLMTIYARGVSVLMPGEEIPTFIAHPAPAPCPSECMSQSRALPGPSSSSNP
ncbi:hypothetical protein RJ640_024474 [Escallonia rubra]|uniref:Uncharacterized protein n=1 Tax=Escallonia rubra TaxID=112253 RepID=A0AA88R454_9ASTE|nr:hypothetical protein RJ640_024474 [Escallonia rubra]